MGLDALSWYNVAQDHSRWYDLCQTISTGGVPRSTTVVASFCLPLQKDSDDMKTLA